MHEFLNFHHLVIYGYPTLSPLNLINLSPDSIIFHSNTTSLHFQHSCKFSDLAHSWYLQSTLSSYIGMLSPSQHYFSILLPYIFYMGTPASCIAPTFKFLRVFSLILTHVLLPVKKSYTDLNHFPPP